MGNQIAEIAGALVTVALVTTIVAHPQSANVMKAAGSAFSNSMVAAEGYGHQV
jgi:hypothetical protein